MTDNQGNGRLGPCGDLSLGHCKEAMDRLDDYLDKDLTPDVKAALEAHLKLCDHCTEEFGLRSAAQDLLRCKLQAEKCPDALRAAILAQLRADCA